MFPFLSFTSIACHIFHLSFCHNPSVILSLYLFPSTSWNIVTSFSLLPVTLAQSTNGCKIMLLPFQGCVQGCDVSYRPYLCMSPPSAPPPSIVVHGKLASEINGHIHLSLSTCVSLTPGPEMQDFQFIYLSVYYRSLPSSLASSHLVCLQFGWCILSIAHSLSVVLSISTCDIALISILIMLNCCRCTHTQTHVYTYVYMELS